MRKYVIERQMPGIGKAVQDQLDQAVARSNDVLKELGTGVQWVQSYVTDDTIYCVYVAENEDLIRRHAQMAGFPADRVAAVRAVLDPATQPAT